MRAAQLTICSLLVYKDSSHVYEQSHVFANQERYLHVHQRHIWADPRNHIPHIWLFVRVPGTFVIIVIVCAPCNEMHMFRCFWYAQM